MADNVIPFPNADTAAMRAYLHRCGKPAPWSDGPPCVLRRRHRGDHETKYGGAWSDTTGEVSADG